MNECPKCRSFTSPKMGEVCPLCKVDDIFASRPLVPVWVIYVLLWAVVFLAIFSIALVIFSR